jgi:hypothetical protein
MAFRTQTAIGLILLAAPLVCAQDFTFAVRHHHLHKGGEGTLRFTRAGIGWTESAKDDTDHSRSWQYANIQRLELSPTRVRIVTYDDVGWQLGRDREYVFDGLPKDLAAQVYPLLTEQMDQRFLAQVADPALKSQWEMPAKLLLGRKGSNGILKVGAGHIVFDGGETGESRTWRIADIENVSSAEPFELTITTIEGENRVQLKEALPTDRFQELWQRISESRGLRVFGQTAAHHH